MGTWDVMRQDDLGNEFHVSAHDSRVAALAQVLVLESGVPHRQIYWVEGPFAPSVRTNRDLYLHVLRVGRDTRAGSWSLSGFLRALWKVSLPLRERDELEADDAAALFSAAVAVSPAPFDPKWSGRDLLLPGAAPRDHADWERVLLAQIADLEDFVVAPPGPRGRFGVDAPRPSGSGPRPTPARWCNFDPATYLECAVAGGVGGWDVSDGARVPSEGGPTRSPVRPLTTVTWEDLARIAVCGQLYE
ncbi:hypothetical protein [Actinomadura rayongensis]|uniref:Uncharacterized protein n=1 Tax=Actinomadura rayongensis TaxID=1429076 RepID=A0A6I4WA77_9ACTN|nr:hypothetical protein [Actinomadura rayongensis]MXQ67087.1 hypothetical protein [Actinomadura rayongensis]